MSTILVAGATGYLGRFIVAELHRRGYQVRALVRDLGRAEAPGIYGSPSLTGLVADWRIGDVTNPHVTADLAHGSPASFPRSASPGKKPTRGTLTTALTWQS